MGTDISTWAQRRTGQGEWIDLDFKPFDWRSYGLFGFLADVRNYSCVPVFAPPRGWPTDFHLERPAVDENGLDRDHRHYYDRYGDYHCKTWFSLAELRAYDYDQRFEDRRVSRTMPSGAIDGGVTADPGDDDTHWTTIREFLGQGFFAELDRLEALGAERIMVCFD